MPIESKVQAENTLTATSDLLRRDSNIPGFGLLLDPERLLASLHTQLDNSLVKDIKLNYLRYKPGMNCLARYELRTHDSTICAYAKAHGRDAGVKVGKSRDRPVNNSVLGPGRIVLEDQQVIFSTFPNDAKLFNLQCLSDNTYRDRLFSRVFGVDSQWRESELDESLNYKPERRYVTRLKRPDGQYALAKFYTRSGYAKAQIVSRKLNHNRFGYCPETLGRSTKYNVIAYQWQPGTTLRQLNICGELSSSDLAATAESLAEFHASACGGLTFPEESVQIDRLDALANQLAVLLPHLEKRAKTVAQKLAGWLKKQTRVKQPVHGDFYDKQAIVNNGKVRLIDLDAACLGNPLLDLGSYIAHLERLAGNHTLSVSDLKTQTNTFITAYEQFTNSVCAEQLNRYIALSLFALIHHPFRDWSSDWPAQTERLLIRVENLLGS